MKNKISVFLLLAGIIGLQLTMPALAKNKNDFYYVYISLRKSDAIVMYKMNAASGELSLCDSLPVEGGPAPMTLSPDNKFLYAGERTTNTLSSFSIDHSTGKLTFLNRIKAVHGPVNLEVDKTGQFLLSVYYASGDAAVYGINKDGSLRDSAIQVIHGFVNPHAIHLDTANRFAFISDKGGDKIYSYHFDVKTGRLSPNSPAFFQTPTGTEPRHFVFYDKLNMVYFVNEKGNTVTSYRYNKEEVTLSVVQNITTLPDGFKEYSKCADIQFSKDHRFLYASNRGHNSIVVYSVNQKTGKLTTKGIYGTVDHPRSFAIDPEGNYLIAANEGGSDIEIHKINKTTGEPKKNKNMTVGEQPSWVIVTGLQ